MKWRSNIGEAFIQSSTLIINGSLVQMFVPEINTREEALAYVQQTYPHVKHICFNAKTHRITCFERHGTSECWRQCE